MSEHWYETHAELLTFASVLDEAGAFDKAKDAIYFFEKPWKWTDEYERWVSFGRPEKLDDLSDLEKSDDERVEKRVVRKYVFAEPDDMAEVCW